MFPAMLVVALLQVDEQSARRPCAESDLYNGWSGTLSGRSGTLTARPRPQIAGCSMIVGSGLGLNSTESLELVQAIASGAGCNATSLDPAQLVQACVRQLNSIALDGNQLGDAGVAILAGALSTPAGSEPLPFEMTLSLGAANIGRLGAIALADLLRRPSNTVVNLALDWNAIGMEGSVALGNALSRYRVGSGVMQNTALRVLGLERCSVGDAGAIALGTALSDNPLLPLREIRLEGNGIGPAGAARLGSALETNTHLRMLNLALNPIGPAGAIELARGLRRNAALERLDLGGCELGDAGTVALATALRSNLALRTLNLQGNGIGAEGAHALASMLRINPSLRSINLRLNGLGHQAATALLEAARNGEAATRGAGRLEELLLEHNLVLLDVLPTVGANRTEAAGTLPPTLLAQAASVGVAASGAVQS
eukprot:jgi/Chrpa1/19123/Chrysochromulina_OHIO_Genome00010434-RA